MAAVLQTTFPNIFMSRSPCILFEISLQPVPEGQINNDSALVQIMPWPRPVDNLLSEPMMTQFTDTYLRLNELTQNDNFLRMQPTTVHTRANVLQQTQFSDTIS